MLCGWIVRGTGNARNTLSRRCQWPVEGGRDGNVPLLKGSVHGSWPEFTPSRVGQCIRQGDVLNSFIQRNNIDLWTSSAEERSHMGRRSDLRGDRAPTYSGCEWVQWISTKDCGFATFSDDIFETGGERHAG